MSRPVFPFSAPDISLLARSLVKQCADEAMPPSHVQMLNMLARAIGYANFQALRTVAEAAPILAAEMPAPIAPGPIAQVKPAAMRLLRHFDAQGRLIRWPGKFSEQQPCIWTLWARIPARRDMSEREVNAFIKLGEAMGDHVLLRRELVNYKLLERTLDGRVYRRVEQPLPPDWAPLVREVLRRSA
jgi:hypothetical protein